MAKDVNFDEPINDAIQIDRLVDGQLTEPQRRRLLTRLDHQPDGWRRCALAFLEAQSWREALGPMVRPESPVSVAPATRPVARRGGRPKRLGALAAMAASFLAAFWVGSLVEPFRRESSDPSVQVVQTAAPPIQETREPLMTVSAPAVPDDVLRALNRTGHQVRQRREMVPVRFDDGRQMVVPVDQVDVHYVGNGTY